MTKKPSKKSSIGSISITDTPESSPTPGSGGSTPPRPEKPDNPVTGSFPRRRQRIKNASVRWLSLLKWSFIIALSLAGLILAAGYLLIPYAAKNILPDALAARIGRDVTIADTDFDPFSLTLTLHNAIIGAKLADKDDKIDPIVSFSKLTINFDSASFIKRALICQELTIDRLYLHVVRNKDLTYNLIEMLHRALPSPDKEATDLTSLAVKYSLHNISLTGGHLIFTDIPAAKSHIAKDIRLDLPVLSNLGSKKLAANEMEKKPTATTVVATASSRYIHPRFSAVINGSPFSFTGETRMIGDKLEAKLDLKMAAMDIPYYLAYLTKGSNFTVTKGTVNLDLDLVFIASPGSEASLQLIGGGKITDLWVRNNLGKTVAKIPTARFDGTFNPLAGRYQIQELTIDAPQFFAGRSAGGNWSFQATDSKKGGKENLWQTAAIYIEQLNINGGRLSFVDQYVKGGFADSWQNIQLSLKSFSSQGKTPAAFTLTAMDEANTRLAAQGAISASPLTAKGQLLIDDIDLPRLNPYFTGKDSHRINTGKLVKTKTNFKLTVANKSSNLQLSEINLQMRNVIVSAQEKREIKLPRLAIEGGKLDTGKRTLALNKLSIEKGEFNLTRESNGQLNLRGLHIFDTFNSEQKNNWQLTVAAFTLQQGKVRYLDTTTRAPAKLSFSGLDLTAAGLASGIGKKAGKFTASGMLNDVTSLQIGGLVTLAPFKMTADLDVANLRITSIKQFLSPDITPHGGTLQAKGQITLPDFTFKGYTTLYDFAYVSGPDKKRKLRCQKAHLRDVNFSLQPLSLSIANITLDQPAFSTTFADAADINPADLFKISPQNPFASRFSSEEASLLIGEMDLREGSISITDRTVSPAYFSQITGLDIKIKSINNKAGSRAPFSLKGTLLFVPPQKKTAATGRSPINLTGTLGLYDENPYLEFNGTLQNFNLYALSPYIGKHLGYEVKSGLLDLDINYHLVHRNIAAEHKIRVHNFELGKQLPNKLTGTPLTLALITEPDGYINLDIPVTGAADDPEFSYRGTLTAALRSLVLKTNISPLSLLASKTVNPGALKYITFNPGTKAIAAGETKKLGQLISILKKRPQLKVRLAGYFDNKTDREAMLTSRRQEAAELRLREEARRSTAISNQYGKEEINPSGLDDHSTVYLGGQTIPEEIIVRDEDLRSLVGKRIKSIITYLQAEGLAKNRIEIINTGKGVSAPESSRPGNRVDLFISAL